MAGTLQGGKHAAETNKRLYGPDYYKRIGALGGSVPTPLKGFGSNPELAAIAGKKGGRASRRPKAVW